MRPHLRLALLAATVALIGCAPPEYRSVDLQVDLVVDPEADPFDAIGSVRACFATDSGSEFELFPRDPGTYLIPALPDGAYDLVILGFDLDSELVRDGEIPSVLAHAEAEGVPVQAGAPPGYVAVPFALCGDDCPVDCAAPVTLGQGSATIGLRRALETDGER